MEISARIDDREVLALLRRLQDKVGNMKPLMTRIGAFYERRVLENFQAEQAPDGTPWKPLAQATMMMNLGAKNKKGEMYGFKKNGGLSAKGKRYITGKRILYERGDLLGSIHFQADKDSMTIGSSGSILYAAIHQFGGKAGRGKKVTIPARPYLAMNQGDGLTLAEQDRSWIMEMVREEIASWQ